ncbi:MAG TPA: phage virion morphogenesis protein [Flavobacteriaceae bacterium]|nr:phage virion morphogenesis protein [Flavobacteriaceae bacterium]
MNIKELENKITRDVAIELADEFDRNFERKAFFDKKWQHAKILNSRGSLMMRTGSLRKSIRYSVKENAILFSSSLPYASIHNEGGEIIVTEKMKRFFWAMYYKSSGAVTKTKKGTVGNSQRNQRLTAEANSWKGLALMKVGQKIKIEQRQFVGDHPALDRPIENIINNNIALFSNEQAKTFMP